MFEELENSLDNQEELNIQQVYEVLNFAKQARILQNITPITANQGMKSIYQNPMGYKMEQIRDMVERPASFERQLREFAQYCYNTQMPFRKLVDYYASILKFDYTIYPVGATDKQMKSDVFVKDYYKALEYLEKLNPKKTFRELMTSVMREDAVFVYYRENSDYIRLHRLPPDYCLIDQESALGYMYAFDLSYFSQSGANINQFAPEFRKYYNNSLKMKNSDNKLYDPTIEPELRNGRWSYWQQLPAGKAWVFKFNFDTNIVNPPLSSLFIPASEIDAYRQLQKNKDMIEAYKIIMGAIPREKNPVAGSKKDNLAISPEIAIEFADRVKAALPEGIDFKALPFEDFKMFEFEETDDLISKSISNLYANSGTSGYLFGSGDKTSVAMIKATQETDVSFVEHMYGQFETFCNYYLAQLNPKSKYQFKIKFEGNTWDTQQRMEQAMKVSQMAMPLPQKIASSMGMTPLEFERQLDMNYALGLESKFMVIPTSYTQSAEKAIATDDKIGRPEKGTDQLGDAGAKTADAGSNIDKQSK